MSPTTDAMGPIDFILLEFPDQEPSGRVAEELIRLVDAGLVRLYDILAIRKTADGSVESFEITEFDSGDASGLRPLAGARSGLLGDDDVLEAASAMEPGTIAVLIVYENAWAAPFVAATYQAGGKLIASARIPALDVIEALEAIDEKE